MPIYEYRCRDCGEALEVRQAFTDDDLTECPNCAGNLRKIFSTPGISFKGSGFYKTDTRSDGGSSSGGSSSSKSSNGDSSESGSSSSGSSDAGSSGSGSDSSSSDSSAGSDSSSSTSSPTKTGASSSSG